MTTEAATKGAVEGKIALRWAIFLGSSIPLAVAVVIVGQGRWWEYLVVQGAATLMVWGSALTHMGFAAIESPWRK